MHRLILLFFIGFSTTISAQRFKDVTIITEKLTEHIYMLKGAGGNIGVSAGEDGVFVIDDQFAELTDKILAAIKEISDKPIHYVVNTHWHGDHTGGNTNMTHQGVKIIAHDNVRKRLEETPKRDNTMRSKEAFCCDYF